MVTSLDVWKFTLEKARHFDGGQRFVRACTLEMHMDMSQDPLCVEIPQGKCWTHIPEPSQPSLCASLRSRNAHGHFTRAILCGNVREKCQTLKIPPRLNTGPQKPTVRTRQCGHTVSRTNPTSQPLMAPLVCYFALVWCNFGQKLHKPQENQEN